MKRNTLPEFANLVGVSATRAGQLRRNGVLTGDTVPELVRSYCAHLREQAAGRASGGSLDLAQERAALAKAQRERLEREAAVAARELLDAREVDLAVAAFAGVITKAMESWPGRLAPPLAACRTTAEASAVLVAATRDIREDLCAAIAANMKPAADLLARGTE